MKNPSFRTFLEKWCGRAVRLESTLRKQYLKAEFNNSTRQALETLVQYDIYVVVDEMTVSRSRSIIAFMAGSVGETGYSTPYLIEVVELEKTGNSTDTQLIITTLRKLYGSDIQYDKVRLLISDAATYVIRVAKKVKNTFTQVLHVTCLAHGLNRVSKIVTIENPAADIFVAETKKNLQKFY